MTMTRKRSRFPNDYCRFTGVLSFAYFLGLPMQMVLGVVSSSVLLVFPISLLSPKIGVGTGTSNSPRVKCPSCGSNVVVESDVRPLRITCQGCDSVIRIED